MFSRSSQALFVLQYTDDTFLVSDGPSSCRVYDPNIHVTIEKIPFAGNDPIKFLGGHIQVPKNTTLYKTPYQPSLPHFCSGWIVLPNPRNKSSITYM